ncbi:hypothetical protein FHX81_0655 [Saccharothrix saharensis]|uniref:Uncharacterized protein n=1 Tax=Saccharothrix saharensis TaxID=571190 RepID=A0A543J6C2_9PSEU|nr:hypothetical protein [Saccharothrix saharensis]TQM78389.1 hypothetical protein FHX81_0655 [Saccharothrix saharensis]
MTTGNAVVTALTALCAALGGLVGLHLLDLDFKRAVTVVVVGGLFGVVVALGLLTVDRRPTPHRVPAAQREPAPAAPREPVRALAEPEPAAANRTWWSETPARPATAPPPASAEPRPSRDGYDVDSAVVAQCPRCGDFRLDLEQGADTYAFRCRNPRCGHRWEWRAGAPWPTTVVRRNLTG